MYWSRKNVFWRIKINHVHIRSYLCFIIVVLKLFGLTLYVRELQSRLQSSYQTARANLESQKELSKEYHDRNVNTTLFAVGEKVLLHVEKVRRGRSVRLSPPRIGSYQITDVDDVNVTLKLPRNRTFKVHANRLKPFFGWLQEHDTPHSDFGLSSSYWHYYRRPPPSTRHYKDLRNRRVYIMIM